MSLEIGQQAPEFTLRDEQGQRVSLSEFRGEKNVLLVFYPFAFSRNCTTEFCSLRDENHDLASTDDLEVFGVSTDPVWALRVWKEQQNYPNRFLSDFWPHGEMSSAYGAFDPAWGGNHRHTFLVDKDGVIRFVERMGAGEVRDQAAWRKAIEALA